MRQIAGELEDFVAAGRVHAVGRLVEDQQLRIVDDGRGQLEPLLHAGGIRFDLAIAGLAETDIIEHFVRPLQGILARHADELAGIGDELDADDCGKRHSSSGAKPTSRRMSSWRLAKIHAENFARAAVDRESGRAACGSWSSCRSRSGRADRSRRAGTETERLSSAVTRAVGLGDAFELKEHENPRQRIRRISKSAERRNGIGRLRSSRSYWEFAGSRELGRRLCPTCGN